MRPSLAARLDTSDAWIRTRTGIGSRHVADPGTSASDLAVTAGARALKSAGAAHADAVVVATTTPERVCPATAPAVAARLGLGPVAAFDVGAVCSGFVYALAAAAGLITAGTAGQVLVIGADTFTRLLDPADRATAVIFGDGAGAVLLRAGHAGEPGALGPFDLGADGEGTDLITVPPGASFAMRGQQVYRLAVEHMTRSAQTALHRAGWRPADVDFLVAHQANARITRRLAENLGIAADRAADHIATVGNTAAASIPLALDDAHARGVLRPGDRLLLTAFGGGLTWGATTLTWPGAACG
jgi:3-oxoacyl-[acyl-carrier-protein] synthase-3